MERPVKYRVFSLGRFFFLGEADQATVEAAMSTIDQSDIRGSSLAARHHGRDPSGAASDYGRGFGGKAYRIGANEDSPFRVPPRPSPGLFPRFHLDS